MKTKIALFASGSGSNVENLVLYFKNHPFISIEEVYCNNPNALVIERCKRLQIPITLFTREYFYKTPKIVDQLVSNQIEWVILAGFLWLIPQNLVCSFPNKMINIHPALLPKYGGKGMYGKYVHEAVVANKETETGITIHFVNEHYDDGNIIFQAKTKLDLSDNADLVAQKIHKLEFEHFPKVIEETIKEQLKK